MYPKSFKQIRIHNWQLLASASVLLRRRDYELLLLGTWVGENIGGCSRLHGLEESVRLTLLDVIQRDIEKTIQIYKKPCSLLYINIAQKVLSEKFLASQDRKYQYRSSKMSHCIDVRMLVSMQFILKPYHELPNRQFQVRMYGKYLPTPAAGWN